MNTHRSIRSLHIIVALLIGVIIGTVEGNVTLGIGVGLALGIALLLTTQADEIELKTSAPTKRSAVSKAVDSKTRTR